MKNKIRKIIWKLPNYKKIPGSYVSDYREEVDQATTEILALIEEEKKKAYRDGVNYQKNLDLMLYGSVVEEIKEELDEE